KSSSLSDRPMWRAININLELRIQTVSDQLFRVVAEEHAGVGLFAESLEEIFRLIGDAAGAFEAADDLALVVCDREFVERAHRAGDEQYNVARAHEHDVAALQAEARVNQSVAGVRG